MGKPGVTEVWLSRWRAWVGKGMASCRPAFLRLMSGISRKNSPNGGNMPTYTSGARATPVRAVRKTLFLAALGIALPGVTGSAFAADPAMPECMQYDKYNVRGSETPIPSNCDTIDPELGGLRKTLADHGWNFQTVVQYSGGYDVLNHEGGPQLYSGQRPSYSLFSMGILTYDLGRIGLNEGSQFAFEPNVMHNTYKMDGDNSVFIGQASALLPFFDGRMSVQAGIYRFGAQFYGTIVGTNLAQSTLGPQSSLFAEVGAQGLKPSPSIDVRLFADDSKRFYTHFGVSRSISPQGIFADAHSNVSGLDFKAKDAKAVYMDELGYRVEGPGQKKLWLRAGGIYNTSNYAKLDNPTETANNKGLYVVGDVQLTQPNPQMFFQGWYVNGRFDWAPDSLNAVSKTYSTTLYKIGTFESRPFDLFSVGVSRSHFSKNLRQTMQTYRMDPEATSTSYSASYTARISSGLYLQTGLTYTDHPTFVPKRDGALTGKAGLTLVF